MTYKKECTMLFSDIVQPPQKLKEAWRKMIPEWAWNAMIDDAVKSLNKYANVYNYQESEIPQKFPLKEIERSIRNKHVFIRREAFFPEAFLADIAEEACKIIKKQ